MPSTRTQTPCMSRNLCCFLAGAWGAIVLSCVYTSQTEVTGITSTELFRATMGNVESPKVEEVRNKIFNRTPRTRPYSPETAPEFGAEFEDSEEFFEFPDVVDEVADPAPVPKAGGFLNAIRNLLNGEGDAEGVVEIVTMVFALFGGAQLGGSDTFFKIILSLFSKKKSFNEILTQQVSSSRKPSRRSRRRSKTT